MGLKTESRKHVVRQVKCKYGLEMFQTCQFTSLDTVSAWADASLLLILCPENKGYPVSTPLALEAFWKGNLSSLTVSLKTESGKHIVRRVKSKHL